MLALELDEIQWGITFNNQMFFRSPVFTNSIITGQVSIEDCKQTNNCMVVAVIYNPYTLSRSRETNTHKHVLACIICMQIDNYYLSNTLNFFFFIDMQTAAQKGWTRDHWPQAFKQYHVCTLWHQQNTDKDLCLFCDIKTVRFKYNLLL